MSKNLKAIVCLSLAALMLLAGCQTEPSSSEPEETVVTTEEPTTAAPTTKPIATADSANVKKYDFLAIKQKNGEITSDFNDIVNEKKFKGVIYAKLGNDFEYISSTGASESTKHKDNSINNKDRKSLWWMDSKWSWKLGNKHDCFWHISDR